MYSYTTAGRPAAGRRDWLHQIAAATNKKQKSFVILFGFKGKNKYFVIFSRIRIFQKWKMKNGIPPFSKMKNEKWNDCPRVFSKMKNSKNQKVNLWIYSKINDWSAEFNVWTVYTFNDWFLKTSKIDFWRRQRLIFWTFDFFIFEKCAFYIYI